MRGKTSFFLTALVIAVLGVLSFLYFSKNNKEVKGTSSVPDTAYTVSDNRDVRSNAPVTSKSAYLNSLLVRISKVAQNEVAKIEDNATFHWTKENDEYEVVGQGIELKEIPSDTEDKIIILLKEEGFELNELNLSSGSAGHSNGYEKIPYVCVVRSVYSEIADFDKKAPINVDIEIRCGQISE